MEWISVEERLPEAADNPVLGYDDMSNMSFMAWYRPISKEWEGFSGFPVKITHWMPLPEPPKGGKP